MFILSLLAEVFMKKVLLTHFPDKDTGLQKPGKVSNGLKLVNAEQEFTDEACLSLEPPYLWQKHNKHADIFFMQGFPPLFPCDLPEPSFPFSVLFWRGWLL